MTCILTSACGVAERRGNEPTVHHLVDEKNRVYAISDGVTTYAGAEVASRMVIEQVSSLGYLPQGDDAVRRWLVNGFRSACTVIRDAGKATHRLRDMTATLTLLHIDPEDQWYILHAGDSRAYLLEGERVQQLTHDHNLAFEMFNAGSISKEELRTHPKARILTRSISASRSFVVPDQMNGRLQPGQIVVLCSSAVTKILDDDEMEEILRSETDPEILATALLEAADTKSPQAGDMTVLVVRFDTAAA